MFVKYILRGNSSCKRVNGGGGGSTRRLSVKIQSLCRKSVEIFDLCRLSVVGKSQLIIKNSC